MSQNPADTTQVWPLEMSGHEFERLVSLAAQHIAAFLDSLPDQPSWNVDDAERIARTVSEPLPQIGIPAEPLLRDLFERLIPVSYNTTGPGYLAYIPGGGLPHAAIADLIANAVNRYVGLWITAPALAQIEATVIRWFCDMVPYPSESGGVLTTGGSFANVLALYTARRCLGNDDFSRSTVYVSQQSHHSVLKAASFVGFPLSQVRQIEVDERFRMRNDALAAQLTTDRAAGFKPLVIVAQAGTTNTGAIDDLSELADVAQRESMWLHVDAAYGGFFLMTIRGRERLRGIERADSITLDPHKGLFLPYGTGCLLVRDRAQLQQANDLQADYLPPHPADPEFIDFSRLSPELSRDFRGLRIWLPFKLQGAEPFRACLDEKLNLIEWVTEKLRCLSSDYGGELEIVAEPQLTVVAFRIRRPGLRECELTQLNREFLDRIHSRRRVCLSTTFLGDRYVLRICILSFRTHYDRMAECIEEIRRALYELGDVRSVSVVPHENASIRRSASTDTPAE